MSHSTLHDRLASAAGSRTYKQLSDLTGTHPETVRRYMLGQSPSVDFLAALCNEMEINAAWLLTGRGPMRLEDMRGNVQSQADPSELLNAVADTMTDLLDRVERLERYCQTMETRLRVSLPALHEPAAAPVAPPQNSSRSAADRHDAHNATDATDRSSPEASIPRRATRISDAIGEQPV